jgi:hypothetical protein
MNRAVSRMRAIPIGTLTRKTPRRPRGPYMTLIFPAIGMAMTWPSA